MGISHVIIYMTLIDLLESMNTEWNMPHLDLVEAPALTDTVDESKAH